jgi:prepilin-type N-terminal cleavage/methylation domain-containing protein
VPIRNNTRATVCILERNPRFSLGRPLAQTQCSMRKHLWNEQRGFTLIDVLTVIVVLGIMAAVTAPGMIASLDRLKLGQATREVERELHVAKSRAVSKGRGIRIRFNCPSAGQYRVTELLGTVTVPAAADNAADRCDQTKYPYPIADNDPLTLPNLDGPVRYLPDDVSFGTSQTIEFWPDGTAHITGATIPWPLIPTVGINITVVRDANTSTITVNGLGKILLVD